MASAMQHEPHGGASVGDNLGHVPRQDPRNSIGAVSSPMSMSMAAPLSGDAPSRTTGFGSTVFDVAVPTETGRRGPESVFDVCHVGVVLRALLFVHGAMAIGMVFGAATFSSWLTMTAAGASVALPGVPDVAARRLRAEGAARPRAARAAVVDRRRRSARSPRSPPRG
jgi:hypothetical protein